MKPARKDSAAARSENMSRIRSKDTKPELLVRQALHRLGFRFRLHAADLPGRPDIVLPRYQAIIEIKGCFWHGHNCIDGRLPKTNQGYWLPKLARNKSRDRKNVRALRKLGWFVRCLWECQIVKLNSASLEELLVRTLRKDALKRGK
ncbi:MAG TPA: DNA mismatch endonuclease Vsr [Terracidiphilus sp.]|nr:DNA mismatch endonuclease Vsr [Terracidiphilus sp.]